MRSIFLMCFILFAFYISNGQSWANAGASWTYSYNELFSYGYVKIERIGDTLINNKQCDVLEKIKYGYTFPGYYDTLELDHEYTYEDSGRIWIYRGNQFWTLYDFNISVGSSWICQGNNSTCPQLGEFNLDSISSIIINDDTLKVLHSSPSPSSGWHFVGPIVEKIGCLGYMLPEPICVFDAEEGGPLRCFSDSSGWSYETGIIPSCNYLNEIYSPTKDVGIKLFPNPASTGFNIRFSNLNNSEINTISIYNYQGQLLDTFSIKNRDTYYSTNNLLNGIYIIRARNNNTNISMLLLIDNN